MVQIQPLGPISTNKGQKDMTLEQAIQQCYQEAERSGTVARNNDSSTVNQPLQWLQLARWLEELKGLREKSQSLQKEVDYLRRDLGQFL